MTSKTSSQGFPKYKQHNMGLEGRKGFANNKAADQPAHMRSLISAFVIRLMESNISRLATNKISIF